MSEISFKNNDLLEGAKSLFLLVKNNYKSLIISTFIALIIGIIYTFSLTPKFHVISTITSSDEQSASLQSTQNIFSTILGANSSTSVDRFFDTMFSTAVAQKMWDNGYNEIFFSSNFDPETNKYLRGEPSNWDRIRSFILNYEINREITPLDLKNSFNSSIEIDQEIGSSNFTISAVTSDPKLYMQLLLDLINTGDSVVKQDKLRYSQQTIDFLTEQLRVVNDVDIKKSLINSIKQEHLEIALLTNDLPYSLKIVDKPYYSGHPISPNLQFIYIFFSFIGFSLGFIRAYLKGHS